MVFAGRSMDIDPNVVERAEGSDVRIMSFNVLSDKAGNNAPIAGGRGQQATDTILRYAPDVIGLQENSDGWYEEFNDKCTNYEYVNYDDRYLKGIVNLSTLAYNTETVKLVDYGQQRYKNWDNAGGRIFTWALFVLKSDLSKMFMVTSTHWNLDQKTRIKQAKELADFIQSVKDSYDLDDIAIFATGDYNSREGTTEYETFLRESGMTDSKYTAKESGLMCYTVHRGDGGGSEKDHNSSYWLRGPISFREKNTETIKSIDHIFTSGSVENLYHDTIIDEDALNASDHLPIFVDAKINSFAFEASSVNIGKWIEDSDNWFSNTDEFIKGNQFVSKYKEMATYYGEKLMPNQMLKFRVNFDLAKWEGWGYSVEDDIARDFMSVTGYSLVVKKNVFEVQRRIMKNGKMVTEILKNIPNDESIINADDWYDIETGILYSEKGPRMILKVNGKMIVDYTDESDDAVYKIGHFNIYNSSNTDGLYIEAVAN